MLRKYTIVVYNFQTTNLAGKEEFALNDVSDNFVEHPAQWKLNKRGVIFIVNVKRIEMMSVTVNRLKEKRLFICCSIAMSQKVPILQNY